MEAVHAQINAALLSAIIVVVRLTQCANMFADLDVVQYCKDQRSLCRDTGSFIHIVCQYYGKTGQSCSKFKQVPLEESNENALLFRINTIRLKAANGKATGKNQQKLPRAYGMKKVFWDSELAAFAKIMIHQCTCKHRYSCAATKTFTDPMMVYSFANTTNSAAEIIDKILSSWEADAMRTTPNEILHSPDLKAGEHYYIKILVGDVTHIGCAAGVYEHEIRPIAIKPRDNIRLSGHMICYLSHYSREGTPVYNTTEPIRGTGWTRCGCPPNYRETKNCLCVPGPIDHSQMRPGTVVTLTAKSAITTSTQAYYDDLEKHLQQIDNFVSPRAKTKPLVLATGRHQNRAQLDSSQQKLEWPPQVSLSHQMQDMLEPKIQQKLKETQLASKDAGNQGSCIGAREPKIVMLPILTIQNAPKHISRSREKNRRSDNTSSVPKTKAIDDIRFSNASIDEPPANMSVRSKLLETMTKIRNKQAADIFSNEKVDHGQKFTQTTLTVEPTKHTVKPDPSTKQQTEGDHTENSKYTVLNILELLEEEKFVESGQSVAEPSKPSINEKTLDGRNEKAKKRVMHLLDLLEEKGEKAQLSSQELVEFDAKMRRIYLSVLGTPRGGGFMKLRDDKHLKA